MYCTFTQFHDTIYTMNEKNTTMVSHASAKMLKKSFDEICMLVAQTNDKRLITDFFECLFTPAERDDFANRWLLVKEIDKGTTQREIAKKFGMSLCKITRGSRELNKEHSAFRIMIEKLKHT